MAVGLSHHGLLLAVVALACSAALACDFEAECRPGESYRLAIPCEGKCAYYIQCEDGKPTEKKCNKYFFQPRYFDPDTLECVKSTDCDWWKKVSTTSTSTTTTTTAAPTTTTPAPDTTPAASSTESTSTSTTVTPEPASSSSEQPTTHPAVPSTTSTPSTSPAPAGSGAVAPVAALAPALLAAAFALIL